jgi:hypothetical protein
MKVNLNFIANRLRGISQAKVVSVSTDTRPRFRTGAIGGEVDKWELGKSISESPMMNNRSLRIMQTSRGR